MPTPTYTLDEIESFKAGTKISLDDAFAVARNVENIRLAKHAENSADADADAKLQAYFDGKNGEVVNMERIHAADHCKAADVRVSRGNSGKARWLLKKAIAHQKQLADNTGKKSTTK